jgi:hypothetical protein
MESAMSTPLEPPDDPAWPFLPIVTPDPPKRRDAERFGALFYLGVAGLFTVVALIAWFAGGAWGMRSVFTDIYILHSTSRTEAERVQAAFDLSRDPHVTQRQLWEIALRKPLPDVARYVVAEATTAEVAQADPRGYGLAVARSEGWPDWLRLLLARPMAYAATIGRPVDLDAVEELASRPDPALALWARYTLAAAPPGDPGSEARLRSAADTPGPQQRLARRLVTALDAPRVADRLAVLDAATFALRTDYPPAAEVWRGWEVRGHRLVAREAPRQVPARVSPITSESRPDGP